MEAVWYQPKSTDVEQPNLERISPEEGGVEVNYFVKDGKLTLLAEICLVGLVLLGFFGAPLLNMPLWLAIPIGLVAVLSAALLIFEGAAASIGLKPLTRAPLGWRKAKKTYEAPADSDDPKDR